MFSRKKRNENWYFEVQLLTLSFKISSIYQIIINENIFIYFTVIEHFFLF